jgi:hypothetical protein
LNVDALIGNKTGTDLVAFSGTGTAATGSIVAKTGATATAANATAALALFEASDSDNSKMVLADGSKVVLLSQDNNAGDSADYDAEVFIVSNSGGILSAEQIAIMDNTGTGINDSSILAWADFV